MSVGHLIIDDDDNAVRMMDELKEIMHSVTENKHTSVVFKVKRGIRIVYLELEPKWDTR